MNTVFDPKYMVSSIPYVLAGIPQTLSIAVVAFAAGSLLGLIGALIKIYRVPVLRQLTDLYISFMRGTPLIVQILLIYYGIPIVLRMIDMEYGTDLDVSKIPALVFMFVAFSLNAGAYLTETIRSAVEAIDSGQMEAAYSVGMSGVQGMTRIVLPQALKVGLPNISNFFIGLLKDTSLAFAASVTDIMGEAKIIAGRTSRFFEAYIVAAAVYWIICIVFELTVARLEKHMRRVEKGRAA